MMKNLPRALLLILVCLFVLPTPGLAASLEAPTIEISEGWISLEVAMRVPPNYHGAINPDRLTALRAEAVTALADREFMYLETVQMGMAPSDVSIETALKDVLRANGGKANLEQALAAQGVSLASYREYLRRVLAEVVINRWSAARAASASDEQRLRDMYQQRVTSYVIPESVDAEMLYFPIEPGVAEAVTRATWARARKAVTFLQDPRQDWHAFAAEVSAQVIAMDHTHRGSASPEIERAIFTTKVGKISGIVETLYGLHIIRVNALQKPRQRSYAEARADVERQFLREYAAAEKAAILNRARAKYRITVAPKSSTR